MATLGTQRHAPGTQLPWPDPSLALPGEPDARTFLRAAAATYLWQVAGGRSAVQPSLTEARRFPADAASRETVSEPAAWRLARMINGDHAELIPEWFALADAAGKMLPVHWLPPVLDKVSAELCARFSAVLGPSASWLADCNDRWRVRPAALEPSEQRWMEGTLAERCADFAMLRLRDPGLARDWLQRTWGTDPPEAREAFVKLLLAGLSMEDEPLLEATLDDKRKGVRLAAAECLARLPEAAHAKRNLARLEPLFVLQDANTGLLAKFRKRQLVVHLPAALDKAAIRDGIEQKPPAQRKIGERIFWLTQMLSMAPPAYWCRRFGCDAATLMQAAAESEFATDLLGALSSAQLRHPDDEWARVLCDAWIASPGDPQAMAQPLSGLIMAAPAQQREELFQSVLRQLESRDFNITLLLMNSRLPWSAETTRLALWSLSARVRGDTQTWSHARTLLDDWASRCDVESAAPAIAQLSMTCPDKSPWRKALEHMAEIVEFRATMKKELLA